MARSSKEELGLTPLTRALWKGIPAFLDLKPDGVTIKDIVAAFKFWDSAVDDGLIAAMMQRLITTPMIEIVRPGHTSQSPSQAGTNRTVEESGLPREISTAEAAKILGVSKDTVLQEMLTFREVAKLLGCSYGEARHRMLDGRIRAIKDGRWCRSRREWVQEYIEKQTVRPEPPPAGVPAQIPKRRKIVNVKANGVAHRFLQNRKD